MLWREGRRLMEIATHFETEVGRKPSGRWEPEVHADLYGLVCDDVFVPLGSLLPGVMRRTTDP